MNLIYKEYEITITRTENGSFVWVLYNQNNRPYESGTATTRKEAISDAKDIVNLIIQA